MTPTVRPTVPPDRRAATPVDLLVVGGTGYLGRALVREGRARTLTVAATHHRQAPLELGCRWLPLDLTAEAAAADLVTSLRPRLLVNAAYVYGGPTLDAVSRRAPAVLAEAGHRAGSRVVHLSTDLVFDGRLGRPYTEDDRPDPVLPYGEAKLAAERAVLAAHPTALVVRTSLLYGGVEPGPQEELVRRAGAGEDITFFVDEIRCPIAVGDLASDLIDLAEAGTDDRDDTPAGLLHLAGPESLDRLSFARRLAPALGVDPNRLVGGHPDPSLGPRPRNCALDSSRARAALAMIRSADPR